MNILKIVVIILSLASVLSACNAANTNATFSGATLSSISVTPANPSIAKGTAQQFTATGMYSDGTTKDITTLVSWSSTSTPVATMGKAPGTIGLATSLTPGSTTITASAEGISGSTTLTVNPAALVSIAVTPTNSSIGFGTSQQFIATGTFADSTTQNLTTSVIWSSLTTSVANISNVAGSNGLAASAAAGTTTIMAIDPITSISGNTTLTITTVQMGGAIQGNPLTLSALVTTLAGKEGFIGSSDGIGTSALFNCTVGITTDGTNLYVTDSGNHTIRKIVISSGIVTTLAGTAGTCGSTDGTGTAALFCAPNGITTDGTNIYVADTSNNTIRKIAISSGVVTTLAGKAGPGGSGFYDGTGSSARFYRP